MNTILFKLWLINQGLSPKISSDNISRLKRLNNSLINSSISSDIDTLYKKDKCSTLLECFKNNGNNQFMDLYKLSSLPVGKPQIHTYKSALQKYISFKEEYPNG